ncbi:MAG: DegT/DnrJ/EryC1/StrS family aminotransferase [Chlamydiae bacterium]|nr:DegT/DnrJ/EryC1/StrS family aminotransferase [Chlamydiota bacterium]MBI3266344.1 DegT/DnrJ/EryC1/StrS family aminotransferase [Chlamydiota bacterium]
MKTLRRNIPVAEPDLDSREREKVLDCVESGWISSIGTYVTQFEESFSHFCGAQYGIACSNGTVALHLALLSLKVGPGDEVICPTLSFVATANAIRHTGATPVFVDSEAFTWNMDPEKMAAKISSKTKAIVVVHLYGHSADLNPILELAQKKGLPLIEDAAEAHGALYRGKKVGGIGTLGCFSFYGNKVITTGEGGMVVTQDSHLAERMRLLRDHAMDSKRRYWHTEIGYNYRLTNLQAAVGVAQMEKIEKFLQIRRENAKIYKLLLREVSGLTLFPEATWATPVYWMVSVLVEEAFGISRDSLMEKLKEKGIDTRPFFIPTHMLPSHREEGPYPVSESLSKKGMNLPSSTRLTQEDIEYVVQTIQEIREG